GHTRSYGDWSSDVCSSDLVGAAQPCAPDPFDSDVFGLKGRLRQPGPEARDTGGMGSGPEGAVRATVWVNGPFRAGMVCGPGPRPDRKSTRLNSSHRTISYA